MNIPVSADTQHRHLKYAIQWVTEQYYVDLKKTKHKYKSCSKAYSGQTSAEKSWYQLEEASKVLHGILEMVMGNVQCVKICELGPWWAQRISWRW